MSSSRGWTLLSPATARRLHRQPSSAPGQSMAWVKSMDADIFSTAAPSRAERYKKRTSATPLTVTRPCSRRVSVTRQHTSWRKMVSIGGLPFFRGSWSSMVNWWLTPFTAWWDCRVLARFSMPSPSRPQVSCSCFCTKTRAETATAACRSMRRALTARQVRCSTRADTVATACSPGPFSFAVAVNSWVKAQHRTRSPLASRYSTRMSHTPWQVRLSPAMV